MTNTCRLRDAISTFEFNSSPSSSSSSAPATVEAVSYRWRLLHVLLKPQALADDYNTGIFFLGLRQFL